MVYTFRLWVEMHASDKDGEPAGSAVKRVQEISERTVDFLRKVEMESKAKYGSKAVHIGVAELLESSESWDV